MPIEAPKSLTCALIGALCAIPALAHADGDHAHSTTFNEELEGGGVVSEGLGLARRFGAPAVGNITISGIPANAQVVQAYLYWVMIAGFDDTVTVDGDSYTGTWIGTSDDTCWGLGENHLYRATVRDTVRENGTYAVSGFDFVEGVLDNQGFSVVVVYQVAGSDFLTRVVVNDGAIYGGNGHTPVVSTQSFDPVGSPILAVRAHYSVGDAQDAEDGATNFNGVAIAWDNFEGDGCPAPGGCSNPAPGGDGAMWDDDTFDLTAMNLVQPGATTAWATIADPEGVDCLVFAAFTTEISYPNPCPDLDIDFYSSCDGDCDDNNPDIHPGATELPNGIDDDCDGIADNFPDADGDGYTSETDCNDGNPAVNPGQPELCDNVVDDDCDGQVDEADCGDGSGDDDDDDSAAGTGDDDDDGRGGGGAVGRRGGCDCGITARRGSGSAISWMISLILVGSARRRRSLA